MRENCYPWRKVTFRGTILDAIRRPVPCIRREMPEKAGYLRVLELGGDLAEPLVNQSRFVEGQGNDMNKIFIAQRSQKGFTLIELMIVVGIIGILVAIAAPNFSRYQSKARQSEAKIALAAVYGAEKSFYSEYSSYVGSKIGRAHV